MSANQSVRAVIFRTLTYLCVVALLFAFWKQQRLLSQINSENERLQEEKEALRQNLSKVSHATTADPAQTLAAGDSETGMQRHRRRTPTGDSDSGSRQPSVAVQATSAAATPITATAPEMDPNRPALILAGAKVAAVPRGLAATLQFSPSKTGPLGPVSVVVRLPEKTNAKILDLSPASSATFTDSSKELSDNGKFAFFIGTPDAAGDVHFTLSLSSPALIDVRGTPGIVPFLMDVQTTGAELVVR